MISYFLMFASLLGERGPLDGRLFVRCWCGSRPSALLQIGRRGELLPYRTPGALERRLLAARVPVMVVLFMLFPRLPGPLWAIPGSTSSGAHRLERHDEPRRHHRTSGSRTRSRFASSSTRPPPRANELYWRGPSLTQFQRPNVVDAPGNARGERVADTIEYRGEPTSYRVMLEPNGRNWAVRARHAAALDDRRQLAAHGQRLSARHVLRRPAGAPARLPRHVARRTTARASR